MVSDLNMTFMVLSGETTWKKRRLGNRRMRGAGVTPGKAKRRGGEEYSRISIFETYLKGLGTKPDNVKMSTACQS
jgi:hypothetical protein